MADTSIIPSQEPEIREEITLESLSTRLDMLGEQMNWLCENLAGVFSLVTTMGANGGGIRGAMKAMKEMGAIDVQEGAQDV